MATGSVYRPQALQKAEEGGFFPRDDRIGAVQFEEPGRAGVGHKGSEHTAGWRSASGGELDVINVEAAHV
jgi:hypothetical protein